MTHYKAEHVAQVLRDRIRSGELSPGTKLPSYDELQEQFGISRPTAARALSAVREEGWVASNGSRFLFVADLPPHRHCYYWVTSEQPGSLKWTRFLATFLELIERQK